MQIEKNAVAGTLESSDALVTVEPAKGGIELDISSSVMNQYGQPPCGVFDLRPHSGGAL